MSKMTAISADRSQDADDVLKKISQALQGLNYGEVRITVHCSKIVQIDRTEKIRVKEVILEEGGGI